MKSYTDFLSWLRQQSGTIMIGQDSGPQEYPSLEELALSGAGAPNELADQIARFLGLKRFSFAELAACPPLTAGFSVRFLREARIYPFLLDNHPAVATADPWDMASVKAAELTLGRPPLCVLATADDIALALSEQVNSVTADPAARETTGTDIELLRDLASGAPVVRALDELFETALEARATDLHIEPFRHELVVRMRVDGVLRPLAAPPQSMAQALISRIKILASLNIAERRLPQDGSARLRIGARDIDMRIATMPTAHGESAAIRLLSGDTKLVDITRIGLGARDEAQLRTFLALPHGMIIITGPTGSGKTTTLAAALSLLNQPSRKILTIEDPIEYEIAGINQSQVKPAIGLTFAQALRAFVRQDPDVIMIGEIRDPETAHIAVHAALTGHLVLTTLHTETAAAAIARLADMGVEPFLLQSTLRGLVAQRLVRILCESCKKHTQIDEARLHREPRLREIGLKPHDRICEPVGCIRCGGTGYKGRTGIFEVLDVNADIRRAIRANADLEHIEAPARQAGMTTMNEDALAKCRAGITSVDEILRLTTVR